MKNQYLHHHLIPMALQSPFVAILLCSFLFYLSPCIAQNAGVVLPVTKDSSTLQYLTHINQRTPLVPVLLTVDLGRQFLWVDCDQGYVSTTYKPIHCRTAQCSLTNSKACGYCPGGPKPGCNDYTCSLSPDNTITLTSTIGDLSQDKVSIQSTDGSARRRAVTVPDFLFTCGTTSLLKGLAKGVKGIAGLGRAKIGMPSQFSSALSLPKKFAICLPSSTTSKGVIIFGDGPSNFLPTAMGASKSLIYTPLLVNPVSTASSHSNGEASTEYFIDVKSIKINGKTVPIKATLLAINSEGIGGTKISTVNPYTVLETSIFDAVNQVFFQELEKFNFTVYTSLSPFGRCFSSGDFNKTRVGWNVPQIDLILQNSTTSWRIFGANSIVQVDEATLCLGFVDGGSNPRTSIVIGAYQLEDNFLQFDLAASMLGFSSSLLLHQTSCSNFRA